MGINKLFEQNKVLFLCIFFILNMLGAFVIVPALSATHNNEKDIIIQQNMISNVNSSLGSLISKVDELSKKVDSNNVMQVRNDEQIRALKDKVDQHQADIKLLFDMVENRNHKH